MALLPNTSAWVFTHPPGSGVTQPLSASVALNFVVSSGTLPGQLGPSDRLLVPPKELVNQVHSAIEEFSMMLLSMMKAP